MTRLLEIMPALTADQVANAYGMNLLPASAALQTMGENIVKQRLLNEENRRRQQALQMQGLGLISDVTNPLEKGTGFSPIDDLHAQRLGEIKRKATALVMAGSDPASIYMQLQQDANGLRAEQTGVTKLISGIDNTVKGITKNDKLLNPDLLRQQMMQNAFYDIDKNGNPVLRPRVNSNVNYAAGLTNMDDATRLNFVDPVALDMAVGEAIPKVFPIQQNVVPGMQGNVQGDYIANIPQTHMIDPKTGQVMLATSPEGGLRGDLIQTLSANPTLRIKLIKETRDILKDNSGMAPELAASIAARRIVETHGTKGDAMAKFDDSRYKRERQAEQDATTNYYRALQAGREGRRLTLAEEKAAKAKDDDAMDPYNVIDGYLKGTLQNNPKGQALANSQTVLMYTPYSKNPLPGVQIHGVAGKTFIDDPTTGQKIQAFAFTDPKTRQPGIRIVPFRETDQTEKQTTGRPYIETKERRYLFGRDAQRFLTGAASQFYLPKKKEQDYDNTAESALP